MEHPPAIPGDEDPTTQVPWPTGRGSQQPESPVAYREPLPALPAVSDEDAPTTSNGKAKKKRKGKKAHATADGAQPRMSVWNLVALSVSMGGAVIMWTMELGWGNPFLLSLGLSEELSSLVWLAGPISGLIAQPLIGAISDSSSSKYRRRFWIVLSTVVIVIVSLALAFVIPISAVLVDLFNVGAGDWDPKRLLRINQVAIGISIFSFWLLDFALNALQASLRNLLLDIVPADQLASANAWHGRMTHAGNIVGFAMGFMHLGGWSILRWLGGDQFRKVCVVSLVVLVVTVTITCYTQHEKGRQKDFKRRGKQFNAVIKNIVRAAKTLPRPIRRVCIVQICAWMGWFPFLFYGTTWIGQVMAQEINADPSVDRATQAGDFAMLLYSIVAVFAGTLLPYLASRDNRLLAESEDEPEDVETVRIRETVRQWRSEAAREGKPLKLPTMPFMLRNIWTAALILFALIMASTFFISTVAEATVAIALLGICWAVACWVPFAIIMEFLKEMDQAAAQERRSRVKSPVRTSTAPPTTGRPAHQRVASVPAGLSELNNGPANERSALIRRHSIMGTDIEANENEMGIAGATPVAGGTVLGIHNIAIVFPQFIISLLSSAIFRIVDGDANAVPDPTEPGTIYLGRNGVAWVMRVGGVFAIVAALVSRKVPPTKTEKQMRRRLAEMGEDRDRESP